MDEIANAILHLTLAFKRQGLAAPVSIELGSNEDGKRVRSLAQNDMLYAPEPSMSYDKPEMVGKICGVLIRSPASWRAHPDGRMEAE